MSYTTFAYLDLRASAYAIKDTESTTVEVKIKNTGPVTGKEVVQLYVHEQHPKVVRPEKELKAFIKVALQPGEEKTVSFKLKSRDFAYYDSLRHDGVVNPGKFDVLVGGSSRELPLRQTIEVEASKQDSAALTRHSLLKEFRNHPKGKAFYKELAEAFDLGNPDEMDMMVKAFLDDMPVYKVCAFSQNRFTEERLDGILKQVG